MQADTTKQQAKSLALDVLYAILAGIIVGTAYHFFQNSNSFAPGGVGGLATITYHLVEQNISWSILMVAFNLPIFVLVGGFDQQKARFHAHHLYACAIVYSQVIRSAWCASLFSCQQRRRL